LAAIGALLIPIAMMLILQCSEEEGFGEFKDKLKEGKVERAYFMVTILYRMGIGYYISAANEDTLSTLIVLLFSIYFLIYNLVNLPFRKAYHNYRANICHLSQFAVLYITMYYRSMNDDATSEELSAMTFPVYIQLGALGISLIVSAIVLMVDICVWVSELREWCQRKNESLVTNDTQDNEVPDGNQRDRTMSFAHMKNDIVVENL
jgi:hypothetical protein